MSGAARDDRAPVTPLVERARAGDQGGWNALVQRYAPLVYSVCLRYRLSAADAEDVGAAVWLRLVERLDSVREPEALAGWLRTTTLNEIRVFLRLKGRLVPSEITELIADPTATVDDSLLALERHVLLRAAFAELSEPCRRLLAMLFDEPATPYGRIAERLAIKKGAIGPTRMRCLAKLRRHPGIAALMGDGALAGTSGT